MHIRNMNIRNMNIRNMPIRNMNIRNMPIRIKHIMQIPLPAAAAIAALMGAMVGVQAAATITVVQRGLTFNKASVSLTKGDRIVFTNEDDVIHNIHIFGPGDDEKDLGLQKPGGTLSYAFDKSGAYAVRCNIHPSVRMTVSVK